MHRVYASPLAVLLFLATLPLGRAAAAETAEELAKKLANPVASLISVPWQSHFDFGFEDNEGFRYTGNLQPVIPFSVSEHWNVISRTILPVIYQEDLVWGGAAARSWSSGGRRNATARGRTLRAGRVRRAAPAKLSA